MSNPKNWLLCTDVYKMGHADQYPPDTTEVYSYLTARSDKKYDSLVFFGLQYILSEYLGAGALKKTLTKENINEFIVEYESILGVSGDKWRKRLEALSRLPHLPLEIRALPEGSIVKPGTVLMTVRNTVTEYYWLPGFLESLFLHVWNPCTVATYSRKYRRLSQAMAEKTCDNTDHVPYSVHDFGYRGASSNETAAISGAAHLVNFLGSDTVLASHLIRTHYAPDPATQISVSVPASEHSVMCSYGRDGEIDAFEHMLTLYPTGIVSIVSDTYNVYHAVSVLASLLSERILARDGRVVFRPDSGEPRLIICGDPSGSSPEVRAGVLQLLWRVFGGTVNSKGYRVLNPKVGLIYGDGMFYERYADILDAMEKQGWASSNLVIGVGGILVQSHSRDDLGFAIKASQIKVDGKLIPIKKDPITDPGKKSLSGYLMQKDGVVKENCSWEEMESGDLKLVYSSHIRYEPQTIESIRARVMAPII